MITEQNKKKIKEIKKLKEYNKQNKYLSWLTFYKDFKRPKSLKNQIKINLTKNSKLKDNFFYFRLRSKNSQIYKNDDRNKHLETFNPYVTMMMTNATNFTKYDHSEYVRTTQIPLSQTQLNFSNSPTEYNNTKNKKFFGLDGKTPLYDNENYDSITDNFKMSTLNDLYMKNSLGMKTIGNISQRENFNTKYNYNNINDRHFTFEDEELANDIFFDGNSKKEERRYKKEDRNKFYKDYNIEKKLTLKEKNEIENDLKFNNEIQVKNLSKRDYRDPFKSKKVLKINSQMIDTVEKIRLDLQCQKFQQEYDTICKLNIKKNRMPDVKIFTKKNQNIDEISALKISKIKSKKKSSSNKDDNKEGEFSNIKEYLSHKMKEQFVHINKISRYDHKVSEFKLDIGIIPINHHPELRTFSSLCYDELKGIIYLYGGIGGKKFGDIWECKYNKKIVWNRVYIPKIEDEEIYEYKEIKEPLPRYGHTTHLKNNKIYVLGGEFENWNKSRYKNEILWIYDLTKKTWEIDEFKIIINKKMKKGLSQINNILKNEDKKMSKNQQNINNKMLNNKIISEKSKSYKYLPKLRGNNLWIKSSRLDYNKNKNFENKERKNLKFNKLSSKISRNNPISISENKKYNDKMDNNNESNLSEKSNNNKILYPSLRRNHVSLLIGSSIFVYGGINTNKNYLNDCWTYDINKGKWDLVDFVGRYPPPLGFHSCCMALEKDQLISENLSIYNKPLSDRKTLPLLKLDGIFFFGGMNEAKTPTNLFFHMSIGVKPAVFDIPPINGKPPAPRISASMDFSPDCNMLIIHGGKNELNNDNFMNDITLLDLESLDWIHPTCNNFLPPERAEHLSVIIGNELIIFGGTSAENLLNFDFILVDLDF